jgi:DNA polymerase-3 subunit beta
MKFITKTDVLEKALKSAILPQRSPLLALEGIKIEAKDSYILLSSTDLQSEYQSKINAEIFQEGQAVVQSKLLQQILSKIDYPEITLELKDNKLILNSFTFTAEITTIDSTEYPDFTIITESENPTFLIEMDSEEFNKYIDSVSYCSSYPDESNPVFSGILIESDENGDINFVATDGSQLAFIKTNYTTHPNIKMVVPLKVIKTIQKEIKGNINISVDNIEDPKIIIFKSQKDFSESTIASRLIEGTFPKYKEVIPKEFKTTVTLSKKTLQDSIKRVMVLSKSKELSGIVIFQITKNTMIVKSIESELGKAKEEIILKKKTGEDLTIHFNGKFIENMLNNIKEDEIKLEFIDESSPLKASFIDSDQFTYLLMPIKIAATI